MNENPCERAPDLIAFLYHELDEREAREFRLHLQQCVQCRKEAASLGVVRESITAWRDEALAGFVARPVPTRPRKSALAALRQFFDLSPLWLKGVTVFATVAFCALAVFAVLRLRTDEVPTVANGDAKYTEQDLDQRVKEALAKQSNANQTGERQTETIAVVEPAKPKKSRAVSTTQLAKSRRPLSRAEREQLAADLRLLSTADDSSVQLIGDRINQ
jgi:hypothetical protein